MLEQLFVQRDGLAYLFLVLGHWNFFLNWVEIELPNLSLHEFVGLVSRAVVEERLLVNTA